MSRYLSQNLSQVTYGFFRHISSCSAILTDCLPDLPPIFKVAIELHPRCLDKRRGVKLRGKFVYDDFVDVIEEYGTCEDTRNCFGSGQSFRYGICI